jgi:mRNA interferase RelE/StbE
MCNKNIVFYTHTSKKDLQKIPKKDSSLIVLKVDEYTKINPFKKAKKLSGIFEGLYRYKIANYRVIFEIDSDGNINLIKILKIKHRKDIYRLK